MNLLYHVAIFKVSLQSLLSQCVSFPAYPDGIIAKLCAEDLFDKHDGLECPDIGTAE